MALTDTGNLHGAVKFAQAAQKAGIKPIIGVELKLGTHPLLTAVIQPRARAELPQAAGATMVTHPAWLTVHKAMLDRTIAHAHHAFG